MSSIHSFTQSVVQLSRSMSRAHGLPATDQQWLSWRDDLTAPPVAVHHWYMTYENPEKTAWVRGGWLSFQYEIEAVFMGMEYLDRQEVACYIERRAAVLLPVRRFTIISEGEIGLLKLEYLFEDILFNEDF